MKRKLIRLFLLGIFTLFSEYTFTQNDYHAEIGLSAGGSYYLGDANNKLFDEMQFMYGGFVRYNLNPRFALKAEFVKIQKIIGYNKAFVNDAINVGDICVEFNFFDLENDPNKTSSKRFSPFIFGGVGVMTDLYNEQKHPEPCLSFGVGMKVKLAERWNFIAQWSNKLLTSSDRLENDPNYNNTNNLNGSNILNNDLLSTITVGISYNFWKKKCDCLNNSYLRR